MGICSSQQLSYRFRGLLLCFLKTSNLLQHLCLSAVHVMAMRGGCIQLKLCGVLGLSVNVILIHLYTFCSGNKYRGKHCLFSFCTFAGWGLQQVQIFTSSLAHGMVYIFKGYWRLRFLLVSVSVMSSFIKMTKWFPILFSKFLSDLKKNHENLQNKTKFDCQRNWVLIDLK